MFHMEQGVKGYNMPLYLSEEMVGAGTLRDPLKPRGADQPGAGTLYLGDTGKTLLYLPQAIAETTKLTQLSGDPEENTTAQTKSTIDSKLGTAITLTRTSDVLAEIMLTAGKGWNVLTPNHLGFIEIWMGGVLWHRKAVVKGGATDSSAFTGTENPLSESGKWATGENAWTDMQKNGNAFPVNSGANSGSRCTTDLGSADHFSQATCTIASSPQYPALLCRMAGNVSYYGEVGIGDNYKIYKSDSSLAFTEIGTGAGTPTSGVVYYFEVSGSTLTLKAAGSTVRTETDSTITTGNNAGIAAYANGAVTNCTMDDWSAGSLGAPAASILRQIMNYS